MKKTFLIAYLGLALLGSLHADGTIQTLVGLTVPDGVNALQTPLGTVGTIVIDPVGNIYYSDSSSHRIRRIDGSTGILTTVAGTGQAGFSGDGGPATVAQLNSPEGLAYVNEANPAVEYLFIVDSGNQRLRSVDLKTGVIQTIAGNGSKAVGASNGDGGPPTVASLSAPSAIYADTNQDIWFVDGSGARVRYFQLGQGNITTTAGSTVLGYGGDGGPSVGAGLNGAESIVVTGGDLYIGCDNRIRKVHPAFGGSITTVAGTGANGDSGDGGPALSGAVLGVAGLTADASGNLLFTDGSFVREVVSSGQRLTTVAGSPLLATYYTGDGGPALSAGVGGSTSPILDSNGNLYFIDDDHIREVSAATQFISTYAGGVVLSVSTTGGVPANKLAFSVMAGPIPAPTPTDLLVGDPGKNGQVFLYHSATGLLTLFAGTGIAGTTGDGGPATDATFYSVDAMARDQAGNIYLGDNEGGNGIVLRRVNATDGNVTLVANVTQSDNYAGDGLNSQDPTVTLGRIGGLATAPGWLYISDSEFNTIRAINLSTGVINRVAGPGVAQTIGFLNGPVLSALFSQPSGLAADSLGNVYVADLGNNAIRKVDLNALTVTTVAGLGPNQPGYRGDGGPATNAGLNAPTSVWLDAAGNLFIADTGNDRIRRVDKATGVISTVVGNGLQGLSGDGGAALLSELNAPIGGMADAAGDLFINDAGNRLVREVTYYHTPTPTPVSLGYSKPVAYPSPASDHICFSYYSQGAGHVGIQVYNLGLQLAARFDDSVTGAGPQVTCGDTTRLATGAYIYRLTLPDGTTDTGKFKVIR